MISDQPGDQGIGLQLGHVQPHLRPDHVSVFPAPLRPHRARRVRYSSRVQAKNDRLLGGLRNCPLAATEKPPAINRA